jgi:hypothetical protein
MWTVSFLFGVLSRRPLRLSSVTAGNRRDYFDFQSYPEAAASTEGIFMQVGDFPV